jgi:hypothetical protein
VLSVIAAPVSKKDFADKKVVKKEIRAFDGVKKAPAKAAAFKSMKATTKVTFKDNKKAAKDLKAVSVAKAPKAKKETIDLTFTSADAVVDWNDQCATEGWWQIEAESDDWYISLSNMGSEEAAGEYAWEDLDPDYCCVYDIVNGSDFIYFVEGSCTVAVAEDGSVNVSGSFTDEAGNIYNIDITYEEPEAPVYPEGGEFECDEVSFSYYSSDGDAWYKLVVAEPEMTFRFDVIVGEGLEDVELDKEYTLDDMLANYTYVNLGETRVSFTEVSFLKSSNEDGSADLNVVATDENGNVWKLHYAFPAAPEALNFETITANVTYTKELYWFWYVYTFEAADEANAIVLEIMPDDSFFGTWEAGEKGDITGAVAPLNGVESEIYSGEVTIEPNAEGFKITGKVLCWNSTEYTLDLTYVIPDATREADFVLADLELTVLEGAWQLMGYNEDSTVFASIAAYADEISGHYTAAELAADYCLLGNEDGDFEMLKAELDVLFTEADSTILITGTFRGQNGEDIPEFNVTLSGRIPTPEVSDLTFEFADEEEGIRVTPSNDDDAWDWYVADEATFETYGAEYIAEAIYGRYGNSYAVNGEQLLSFEEDLAYYLTASGNFYLIVWGAGANNITTEPFVHEFVFDSGLPEGCTNYDAAEGNDFLANFAEFGVFAGEAEGEWWIEAQGDNGEYLVLEISAPELVAGVYPIAEDSAEPFVAAGSLDLSEGNIYGSFAGFLTESGQIQVPLWCLFAGNVTLNEDGTADVDAVNCAGAKIVCHLGAGEQAIDNVDAAVKATKRVVNGQLVIIKNGVEYNAQGAIIK